VEQLYIVVKTNEDISLTEISGLEKALINGLKNRIDI